jgi:energy-coupling factor transporter transmembrane protein EcfT
MFLLVIPVTFSNDCYYPAGILIVLMAVGIVAGFSPASFARSMSAVIIGAFCLCVFLVLTRAMHQDGDIKFGVFGIKYADIALAVSLALRMLGFAYAAFLFSRSVDPVILTLSLIQYWHLPYQAGYAFLTAYRFVPTFHEELQKVKIAHEARGAGGKNRLTQLLHTPAYLAPLMVQALRAGERVAISMDARAFGLCDKRTHYKTAHFGAKEKRAIIVSALFLAAYTAAMIASGLFVFGLGFS